MADTQADEFDAKLHALIDLIPPRSQEIERAGKIPSDLIAQMKAAGIFRMFAQKEYGGLELDFR